MKVCNLLLLPFLALGCIEWEGRIGVPNDVNIASTENNRRRRLILNGAAASTGEYPWQAVFVSQSPQGLYVTCGGSLITRRHILFAQHCTEGWNQENIPQVCLGKFNWDPKTQAIKCESKFDIYGDTTILKCLSIYVSEAFTYTLIIQ